MALWTGKNYSPLFLYLLLALWQKAREVKFTEGDHEKSFKMFYIFSLHKHAVNFECKQCQGTASQTPGVHPSQTNYAPCYLSCYSLLPFIQSLPMPGFCVSVGEKKQPQLLKLTSCGKISNTELSSVTSQGDNRCPCLARGLSKECWHLAGVSRRNAVVRRWSLQAPFPNLQGLVHVNKTK